ncbi:MAG: hypothetical protein JRI71_14620, partial [Deltaproteobacteria bacterium]|nr:hypothetical protein [Deltaproteobacteria bacterium]
MIKLRREGSRILWLKNLVVYLPFLGHFSYYLLFAHYLPYSFHWISGNPFWGWEAGIAYQWNGEGVLYKDVVLTHPFMGTYLIHLLSGRLGLVEGYLRCEFILVGFGFTLAGLGGYLASARFFNKYLAMGIALSFMFFSHNIVNPMAYNALAMGFAALSFGSYCHCLSTKDDQHVSLFWPGLVGFSASICLLSKQSLGIGLFLGYLLIIAVRICTIKPRLEEIHVGVTLLGVTLAVFLIVLVGFSWAGIISFNGFLRFVFLSGAEQKGGLLEIIHRFVIFPLRRFTLWGAPIIALSVGFIFARRNEARWTKLEFWVVGTAIIFCVMTPLIAYLGIYVVKIDPLPIFFRKLWRIFIHMLIQFISLLGLGYICVRIWRIMKGRLRKNETCLYFDLSLVLVAYFALWFLMMSSKTADLSVY